LPNFVISGMSPMPIGAPPISGASAGAVSSSSDGMKKYPDVR
jgi:hypothetical protein